MKQVTKKEILDRWGLSVYGISAFLDGRPNRAKIDRHFEVSQQLFNAICAGVANYSELTEEQRKNALVSTVELWGGVLRISDIYMTNHKFYDVLVCGTEATK